MMTIRLRNLAARAAAALPLFAGASAAVAASAPATAFAHHLTGTVVAVTGASLSLRLRTAEQVSIDLTAAQQKGQLGVLPLGRPVTVYGERGSDGRFHATSIGHAAPTARSWPVDAP